MKTTKKILICTFMLMFLMTNIKYAYATEIPADGEYKVKITFTGGTGRVTAKSPMGLSVSGGKMTGTIVLTSSNYTYMIVDGIKYNNSASVGQDSTFIVPITALDTELDIIACTEAMSVPQEIEYVINISSEGTNSVKNSSEDVKEDVKEDVAKTTESKQNTSVDSTDKKSNDNLETKVDEVKSEELKKEEPVDGSKKDLDESKETTKEVKAEDSPKADGKSEAPVEVANETKEKSNNTIFIFLGIIIIGGIGMIIYKKKNK